MKFLLVLSFSLLAIATESFGQDKMPLEDALKSMKQANQAFKKVLSKEGYRNLQVSLERSAPTDGDLAATSRARQDLKTYYEELSFSIKNFNTFTGDARDLNNLVKGIRNEIYNQKAINPTDDILGTSFSKVVLSAAETDLAPSVGKSTFQKIAGLIVDNDFVKTFTDSNPLFSMARDVVSQAVNVSNGKLEQKAIQRYSAKLEPYFAFYNEFGSKADNLLGQRPYPELQPINACDHFLSMIRLTK